MLAGLSVGWGQWQAVVALTHQPVRDSQYKGDGCQTKQLIGGSFFEIQNDELARESKNRDKQDYLGLDYALFAGAHVMESVVELHGDNYRQNFTENSLKYRGLKGIQGTEHQTTKNRDDEAAQVDHDDKADDETECEGDQAFESLPDGQPRELASR